MDIFSSQTAKPMLISEIDEPFDSPDWLFELKLDGERCLAYVDTSGTTLVNRRERRILPQFPELADLGRHVGRRCILDGEIIVGAGGKQDFESIKERSLVKNTYRIKRLSQEKPAVFVALDVLYLDHQEITRQPLEKRITLLAELVKENAFLVQSRTFLKNGKRLFEQVKKKGLEGIVAKKLDSVYLMGKRTRDWVKIKNWLEDTFVICGYFSNENAAVASLILGQHRENGTMRYAGRVTLGRKRREFQIIEDIGKRKRHPFRSMPDIETKAEITWVKPVLVCSAGFMCRYRDNTLRQPFFKGLHPDIAAESVFEPKFDAAASCVGEPQA